MYHKGKYTNLVNPKKYVGNPDNIIYRSHWERNVMRWLDTDDNVLEWASEEISFPYQHPILNRRARYFPDFYIKFASGDQKIIEIKPKNQTVKPEKKRGKPTQRYLEEMMTWATNCEKWDVAMTAAKQNNFIFEIWTEEKLEEMGILKWKTDKTTLTKERATSKKPKMMKFTKGKKRPYTRPKRKS